MAVPGRETVAIVLEEPRRLALRRMELPQFGSDDIVVDVEWSGISAGTERLLWSGSMPPFPGMGYPLVPGYESVGRIAAKGDNSDFDIGARVFVPGARCFGDVRSLFGGAASRLIVPSSRALVLPDELGEQGILFALAATAHHAMFAETARKPDLIVGHGVLGRLLARIAMTMPGPPPVVWESHEGRRSGATGYTVVSAEEDGRKDYTAIYDVSGDAGILNALIARLARRGEITLAGFYSGQVAFSFPPAFMREARLRVAAEWDEKDLLSVRRLVSDGALSLDGLISHRSPASAAGAAYATAFEDPDCLKMILDWRGCQ